MTTAATESFGVYVHIPFCASKCDYCAFATWTDRHHLTDGYMDALMVAIERAVTKGMLDATSIFVGGGTPSMVDGIALGKVIASIPLTPGAEVTVECNPDNVTPQLLDSYLAAGVNRISLGVQSMATHVLGSLGRRHDQRNVRTAVESIKAAGFSTFNLDVIYGASGESIADWEHTVRSILELDPPHVSAYALTIEAGTPLAAQRDRHPDDDDQADKYDLVDELLGAAGLTNYEVSNWARDGHECRHNLLYWRQQNYLGFGCAAHSHIDGRRSWNVRTPERYIESIRANESPESAGETLDESTRAFERLELQLRTSSGVPIDALDGDDLAGMVQREGDRWVLTRAGRLMANEVSLRLKY